MAILFTAQVKPVLTEDVFKWDVAFVESVNTESAPQTTLEAAQAAVPPVQAPPVVARRPVEPPPDAVLHRVAPQQTVQKVHPEVQPTKSVEPREELPPAPNVEPPTPVAKLEKPVEPVETSKAEPVMPPKELEPLQSTEPVIAQQQPVAPSPSEAVDTNPVETPAPSASTPVASSAHAEPAPAISPAANSAPQERPMQTARVAPNGDVKADHRWLADSLWRRVAELKRYPSSARLNGQEGKVILKAVIRADGQLAEVTIQKSSGHQILDVAAIEAVKLAFPLHMKHAISKPEIVVSLPIVYSLAN